MDFTAVRELIAARLEQIEGLSVYDDNVADVVVPCALVTAAGPVSYHQTMNPDSCDYIQEVMVIVSPVESREQGRRLDEYMSPTGARSIRERIEDGTISLDGEVGSVHVASCEKPQSVEIAGKVYTSVTFQLLVKGA